MDISPRKQKRAAPKVDLTAMVDLGFLLITFFMLATSFSKPKTMEILKPDEDGEFDYPVSKTTTIVVGARDKVYVYSLPEELNSLSDFSFDSVSYHPSGLRKYILKRQSQVEQAWGQRDQLFVIIKPLPHASMKNMVDVLDEMLITNVKRYAIVQPDRVIDSLVAVQAGEKWRD